MFSLNELKAGDFIDCENYYRAIATPDDYSEKELLEIIQKFFVLLNNKVPNVESEFVEIIKEYVKQLTEIKEQYIWIYNPPSVIPSNAKQTNNLASELRKEFAEDYQGYIEMIYVLSNGKYLDIPKVLQMKTKDFLFWGEYALRKRIVEQAK